MYLCDTYLHTSIFNIPKGSKNMDNKSDELFIIMQYSIEAKKQDMRDNKQDSDEKMKKFTE